MNGNQPRGGQWSYDKDNRQKIPAHVTIPSFHPLQRTSVNQKIIQEAIAYTNLHFPDNYGSLSFFVYPIDFEESHSWLNDFITHRFQLFGKYEDAVVQENANPFLFHSGLSPMMNIGLLTEAEVIDGIQPWEKKIAPASYEGFLRQCIGWRNYIYTSYVLFGEEMRHSNFLHHTQSAHASMKHRMWNASTDIPPIDMILQKINHYAYAHHIERLMYLGNFLSYCFIHPHDVYTLFMEWTIDAYDWVMIPNVMGMSQYACENKIMNRPYLCSSNYILKMSDFKKGEWTVLWDSLYYQYIERHQKILKSNYSASRQVAFWKKKSEKQKREILARAQKYLHSFTNEKVDNDHGHKKQQKENNSGH
jgi:deoxyribodipyrimidine photolyase-related protein